MIKFFKHQCDELKATESLWLIKELRYKFGNEFTYKGIHIKVVV